MRGRLTATSKVEKQGYVGLSGTLTHFQDVSKRIVFRHEERDVLKSTNARVGVDLICFSLNLEDPLFYPRPSVDGFRIHVTDRMKQELDLRL